MYSVASCVVGRSGITATWLWLAALSQLAHRRRWADIFPVTPATPRRWHRHLVARKWTYTDRTAVHRRFDQDAERVDSAGQSGLGHRRIRGGLARLGYVIAASTVWEILNTAGGKLDPFKPAASSSGSSRTSLSSSSSPMRHQPCRTAVHPPE
ncbi:hypothetical protein GCM10010191_89590 [Actinomadura vinacea]|uniref:Transposase n=2 Tax=Actinomadura vinacea TaxID=115336 RepID=A0ABN3KD95_9ACTN